HHAELVAGRAAVEAGHASLPEGGFGGGVVRIQPDVAHGRGADERAERPLRARPVKETGPYRLRDQARTLGERVGDVRLEVGAGRDGLDDVRGGQGLPELRN